MVIDIKPSPNGRTRYISPNHGTNSNRSYLLSSVSNPSERSQPEKRSRNNRQPEAIASSKKPPEQSSAIAAYINRFRTAPPSSPSDRQEILPKCKSFWWISKKTIDSDQLLVGTSIACSKGSAEIDTQGILRDAQANKDFTSSVLLTGKNQRQPSHALGVSSLEPPRCSQGQKEGRVSKDLNTSHSKPTDCVKEPGRKDRVENERSSENVSACIEEDEGEESQEGTFLKNNISTTCCQKRGLTEAKPSVREGLLVESIQTQEKSDANLDKSQLSTNSNREFQSDLSDEPKKEFKESATSPDRFRTGDSTGSFKESRTLDTSYFEVMEFSIFPEHERFEPVVDEEIAHGSNGSTAVSIAEDLFDRASTLYGNEATEDDEIEDLLEKWRLERRLSSLKNQAPSSTKVVESSFIFDFPLIPSLTNEAKPLSSMSFLEPAELSFIPPTDISIGEHPNSFNFSEGHSEFQQSQFPEVTEIDAQTELSSLGNSQSKCDAVCQTEMLSLAEEFSARDNDVADDIVRDIDECREENHMGLTKNNLKEVIQDDHTTLNIENQIEEVVDLVFTSPNRLHKASSLMLNLEKIDQNRKRNGCNAVFDLSTDQSITALPAVDGSIESNLNQPELHIDSSDTLISQPISEEEFTMILANHGAQQYQNDEILQTLLKTISLLHYRIQNFQFQN